MNAKIQIPDPDQDPTADAANDGAASQVLRLNATQPNAQDIPGLVAACAVNWDGQSGVVTLQFGTAHVPATLHESVDPVVVRRAIEKRELVIAHRPSAQWQVIGVLRTSATPGVDIGDEFVIEARRVSVKASHELSLSSGAVRIALAAIGRIESVAKHITSRASAVHKIIGRAIHLN